MTVYYLPLEPYRERYTEQLLQWTTDAFSRRGVSYAFIRGDQTPNTISTGPVLDAHGRCVYALTQMAHLVKAIPHMKPDDWIFIEDLFTPGFEALPYIFDQLDWRPSIATRNYAQSVDPDDFTHAMMYWMRPYEQMVGKVVDVIFVASTVHKEMWENANLPGMQEVVGLPFDSAAVRRQWPGLVRPWAERERMVVYSSRLDAEKQPHFFMDIVEAAQCDDDPIQFVVCTGSDEIRSNDPTVAPRLLGMAEKGQLRIARGLTKHRYYSILSRARVQLNTARQDFVSFTALEASAFEVPTLAPAFRSFPEALENRETQLYVPWSIEDACVRLERLLRHGEPRCTRLAAYHDQTLDRMIDTFQR